MTEDEWMAELRRAAGAVAPTSEAAGAVRRGVVRRRRRRRGAGAVAGTVLAVATVGVASALAGGGGPTPDPQIHTPPVAQDTTTPPPTTGPEGFSCALESKVFGEAPPIPDLAEQQQVLDRLADINEVVHAEATALGVVALVADDTGDQDYWAEPDVVDRLTELGAAYVYEWDPSGSEVGLNAAAQVQQVLQWQLDPAVRDLRQGIRGVPGYAELALWQEAGGVLLSWKAPVPPEIEALAGTRDDGVRVWVEPVTYAEADVQRAQGRLQDWLRQTQRRDDWAVSYGCADGSGLVVGMLPRAAAEPGLSDEIEAAVGMPVRVVAEERPVSLVGRIGGR